MKVLITGITGQTGSYIAEEYLERGWDIIGLRRRTSQDNLDNIRDIIDSIKLYEGDLTDISSLYIALGEKPDHIINCGAQSHVATSFTNPLTTFDITGKGVLNLLEVVKNICPDSKVLQFSSSEMFGLQYSEPGDTYTPDNYYGKFQYEGTKMEPISPYAIAKLAGYNFIRLYRRYGIFTSNIIGFNHESPRRSDTFVTKKITNWIKNFLKWEDEFALCGRENLLFDSNDIVCTWTGYTFPKLKLGNIDSMRDWTFAGDTAKAAYLILNHSTPDDFVVGTGDTHSIRDFLKEAFTQYDLNYEDCIVIDPTLFRPADVTYLRAYPKKIKETLGWEPTVNFKELVRIMLA